MQLESRLRRPVFTIFIIALCTLLYFFSFSQRLRMNPMSFMASKEAVAFTPIEEALLFDFPEKFELIDQFWKTAKVKKPEDLKRLSPEEQALWDEIKNTPYWEGYYYFLLGYPDSKGQLKLPLFTDIRGGEIYRLVTPVILHGGLLHLLFNMLWLWLLGRMVEERIGVVRYLAIMVIVAVISDTAQYLMSGPAFLGYSGIICGLAGFVYVRQKLAPWEGYPLQKLTALFLGVFILGLFAFQVVMFFLQRFGVTSLDLPIANTAHIVGALTGMGLARVKGIGY